MVNGTLYVSHAQAGYEATVAHTQSLLQQHYGEDFNLEIVDVLDEPDKADAAHVVATPVLVMSNGEGEKRFIGDLDPIAVATKL